MKLPRKSYYYKTKGNPSDNFLEERMSDICLEFPRYGYRRVTKQLQREGWAVNHKKVSRIMREKGWSCHPRKKKWIATTNSNHGFQICPNLIKKLNINSVNQIWVADITYIHILTCFVYLAVILDAYSRKTVGYALSKHIDTKTSRWMLYIWIDRTDSPNQVVFTIRIVVYSMLLLSM